MSSHEPGRSLRDPLLMVYRLGKPRWQKQYFQGRTPDGTAAPSHQTRLHLRAFTLPRGDGPQQRVDDCGLRKQTTERPKRQDYLEAHPLDDRTVVVDPVSGEYHALNETALLIWEHCDGEHSLDDLADVLVRRFALDPDEARADVRDLVERLEMAGLLAQ